MEMKMEMEMKMKMEMEMKMKMKMKMKLICNFYDTQYAPVDTISSHDLSRGNLRTRRVFLPHGR
jgi:hypothetical protein